MNNFIYVKTYSQAKNGDYELTTTREYRKYARARSAKKLLEQTNDLVLISGSKRGVS